MAADLAMSSTIPPPKYELNDTSSLSSSTRESRAPSMSSDSGSSYRSSLLSYTSSSADSETSYETETLPSYTSAFQKRDFLQMKPELTSPFCKATRRNWRTVEIEVNNTMLSLRQSSFCGTVSRTETYSLQFAEVGLASDYIKRQHVFRLRVESKQFVFDCSSRKQMLSWMVGLQMAISLALPLELRQLPEEVKRRRNIQRERERRRNRERNQQRRRQRREQQQDEERRNQPHQTDQLEDTETQQYSQQKRSRGIPHSGTGMRISREENRDECVKWHPRRHQSRFSEKDFPHLTVNTSWEGKNIIYEGQWAFVQNRKIVIIGAGNGSPNQEGLSLT